MRRDSNRGLWRGYAPFMGWPEQSESARGPGPLAGARKHLLSATSNARPLRHLFLEYSDLTTKYAVHPHPSPLPQGRGIFKRS